MAVVMNHLDAPMTLAGLKISAMGPIMGGVLFTALFDNFFIGLGVLVVLSILKRVSGKLPKFTISRWIYRSIPTSSSIWGNSLDTMIESHKEEWCK